MKLFKYIRLLFLLPAFAMYQPVEFAKQKELNSLLLDLHQTTNDTIRMDLYRELGFYYQEENADSSLYFHQKQLVLAQQFKFKLWEADAYQQIGYVQARLNNLSESLQAFLKGFEIAEDEDSEINSWKVSRFSYAENPRNARLAIVGMLYHDMSYLFKVTRKYEDQLQHLQASIKIGESINNKKILALSNMNLGELYLIMHQEDSAFVHLQKALHYFNTSKYQKQKGFLIEKIGVYYLEINNYDSAKKYFKKAIYINMEQNQMQSLSNSYLEFGSIFILNNEIDSSLYYTTKGLETARAANLFSIVAKANTRLSAIYKLQNKSDQSIIYLQKAKTLTDSLNYFYIDKLIQFQNIDFDEQLKLVDIEKEKIVYQNRVRTYFFLTVLGIFLIAGFILYRNDRQKIRANKKLEKTLSNLKATQSQLIQSEKMASLGELTAGIAHEIQNPLNFVNNFSEVSKELADELEEEVQKPDSDKALLSEIAKDIAQNQEKINHHGQRASSIVKGMLEHSRTSDGQKELTDINALADEYLRLAYHGLRAKDKSFNADFKTDLEESLPKISVIPQDFGRVLLNLINNAFFAVDKRSKEGIDGYKPVVIISTKKHSKSIEISVKDNGNGIPNNIKDKIFQPFFTTKPTGQGTGLGLSLSYDIVKVHGGELMVETKESEGSEFIIILPVKT